MATSGLTVTTRSATSGAVRVELAEQPPERLLGRDPAPVGAAEVGGHGRRGAAASGRPLQALAPSRAQSRPSSESGAKVAHGSSGSQPRRSASAAHLLGGEERGVVGRVALGRQPPALERVGEDHDRAVGDRVRLAVGVERASAGRARPGRGSRGASVASSRSPTSRASGVPPPAGPGSRSRSLGDVGAQQALVLLVAHRVDAPAQVVAPRPGEQLAQQPPVLGRDRVPAGGREHVPQTARGDVGHHPVERLAVEVDDPHHLPEAGRPSGRPAPPRSRPRRARRRRSGRCAARRPGRRNGRPRTGGRGPPTAWPSRRCPRTRSRSRPGPGPWSGSGSSAGRRTRAATPCPPAAGGRAGS